MINFFAYDHQENKIIVNEPEIFLVKEFAELWDDKRNMCKEDPQGTHKYKGFKELIYIYLAIDWRAPGSKDTPANRHKLAMESSGLTAEEYADPVFRAACNRYRELQESSSFIGQLLESYKNNFHKMKAFLDGIDYSERKDNGDPIFKIKDTLIEIQNLNKVLESMKDIEAKYKAEVEEISGLRGDQTPGVLD